jgi:putative tricarboxylic transport membrane protein
MIPSSPVYARVGPTLFPYAIGVGLVLLGIALVLEAIFAASPTEPAEPLPEIDFPAVGWVIAGAVICIATIDTAGFVISSTLQYVATARGFGSRRPLRDLGIGLAVTLTAFFGFARLLGVNIGAGLLEGLF